MDMIIGKDFYRDQEGWVTAIVTPSGQPKRNWDYYDLLAQAEEELSSQGLKIKLLPVRPG